LGSKTDPELIWRRYFELMGELADTRMYDVAAHFDLPKRFGNAIPKERLRAFVLPALDRLAAAGMALEINTSGLNHACQSCYPSLAILTWACERGVGLTFGSDSHTPERVGAGFAHAVALARQAGYTQSWVYRKRKSRPRDLPA
jgi:histidinol-phosphatase (PHP family)